MTGMQLPKKVKSFIDDYNDVVKEAGESNTKDVLRNASWMTGMTDKTAQKAAGISNAANRASATYTNNGTYSKKDSSLTSSKIDKEV